MVDGKFITLIINKLGDDGVGISFCVLFTKNKFKFNTVKSFKFVGGPILWIVGILWGCKFQNLFSSRM